MSPNYVFIEPARAKMQAVGIKRSHLLLEQQRQVVERCGHFRMVRPQDLQLNAYSAEAKSLCFRVVTLQETPARL